MRDGKIHSGVLQEKDKCRDGQTIAEYAMILTFVALACVAAVTLMGGSVSGFFSGFGGSF